jgi:hypothetical protein
MGGFSLTEYEVRREIDGLRARRLVNVTPLELWQSPPSYLEGHVVQYLVEFINFAVASHQITKHDGECECECGQVSLTLLR